MAATATRAATAADGAALLALSRAQDVGWWGHPETDEDEVAQRLRLAGDLGRRSRVVEHDGRLVAAAIVFGSADDTDLLLDPGAPAAVRREAADLLLGWLTESGIDEVEAPAQDGERLAWLARHGYLPAWSSYELERSPRRALPVVGLPAGVELRPFDLDAHAPAVHQLLYRFWTEVPTHRERDYGEWRELFLEHGAFDPALQVVAWRGDSPVGAALCRVFDGDAGWILQLGVPPEERGHGLGRALLVEASRRLGQVDGVSTVGLSVVARNARALALYRSAGFELTREWVACVRGGVSPA